MRLNIVMVFAITAFGCTAGPGFLSQEGEQEPLLDVPTEDLGLSLIHI